jgi:hypothetical protein
MDSFCRDDSADFTFALVDFGEFYRSNSHINISLESEACLTAKIGNKTCPFDDVIKVPLGISATEHI